MRQQVRSRCTTEFGRAVERWLEWQKLQKSRESFGASLVADPRLVLEVPGDGDIPEISRVGVPRIKIPESQHRKIASQMMNYFPEFFAVVVVLALAFFLAVRW